MTEQEAFEKVYKACCAHPGWMMRVGRVKGKVVLDDKSRTFVAGGETWAEVWERLPAGSIEEAMQRLQEERQ